MSLVLSRQAFSCLSNRLLKMVRGDGLASVGHLGHQLADEAVGLLGRHGEEEADHHLSLGCCQQPVLVLQQDIVQKIFNMASVNPFRVKT